MRRRRTGGPHRMEGVVAMVVIFILATLGLTAGGWRSGGAIWAAPVATPWNRALVDDGELAADRFVAVIGLRGAGSLTCDPEVCDGLDNDCDGEVDEDFDVGAACSAGSGSCIVSGTTVCAPGGATTVCNVAAPVSLSVADGIPGVPAQDVMVPVAVSDVTGLDVLSADLVLSYDQAVLQATSVVAGTIDSGPDCVVTPNLMVPGQVSVSIFCTSFMTGSGSLAAITFGVVGTAGQTSPLELVSARLNEGVPASCPDGGSVYVCGPPSSDDDCDGFDDDCSGAADEDYLPVPTSCGIPACGDTGTTSCVAGTIVDSCVPRDASLSLPSGLTAPPSGMLTAPIQVSDLTGLGVFSSDLEIAYDPAVLQSESVSAGSLTGACTVTGNLTIPGAVRVSVYCASPLSGSGSLAEVTFTAIGSFGAASALDLVAGLLNEGVPTACGVGGSASVCGAEICDGLDNDCDGLVDEDLAGLGLPDGVSDVPGGTIVAPVQTTDLTGLGILSSDLDLGYDESVLQPLAVSPGSLTGACTVTSNLTNPGHVIVSVFCTSALSGSGSLVEVTFRVIGSYGASSPLVFDSAMFNEGQPPVCPADGSWSLCGDASAEICDGLDNDCNGIVDDGYAVGAGCVLMPGTCPPPAHVVCRPDGLGTICVNDVLLDVSHGAPPATAIVSWVAIPGASLYDVVRGDMLVLQSTGGDFAGATGLCIVDDLAATSVQDPDVPLPEGGFWYLMRAAQCTGGSTYEEGSPTQVGLRDPGISLSGQSCP